MKKKLFLLIIFITPCLSWSAAAPLSPVRKKDRRPANQPAACPQMKNTKRAVDQAYRLGVKNQTERIRSNIAEIIKKQGACGDDKI
jgi:hypothetical protein